MKDFTADKTANFEVDGYRLWMPKEGELKVSELLGKAGSGLFK